LPRSLLLPLLLAACHNGGKSDGQAQGGSAQAGQGDQNEAGAKAGTAAAPDGGAWSSDGARQRLSAERAAVARQVAHESPAHPDCGPGCRIALGPVTHGGWGHAFNEQFVADSGPKSLYLARVGSNETRNVSSGVLPAFYGNAFSYLVNTFPSGDIAVYDITKAKTTPYFHFDDNTKFGSVQTFLSDKYVFWSYSGGVGKADLRTGEVTKFYKRELQCDATCFHGNDLVCGENARRVQLIDQNSGTARPLDDGGAMQAESSCRPDATGIVWVDYRDPPGQSSTLDARSGGEIYLYDFGAGATKRLTHDSPARPIPKAYPAIDSDLATWLEPCASCASTYTDEGQFYSAMSTLVRFKLATGERCRLENVTYGVWPSLHGHHLYSYWSSPEGRFLVDVDLDDAQLAWKCD
jgi:hypothetical protein